MRRIAWCLIKHRETSLLDTYLNILLIINHGKLLITNHTYLFNSVADSTKDIFIGKY